ncbi:unnamed protein product [Meloidogyne enterolobii]|uniref:Uncharacterized protein n=1 Tax=Meloidogyne enterolobii TaxID=390850 RepID=A0ACB1A226_MELEN
MKINNFLTVFIFNWLLWTFVKTSSIEECSEKDYTEKDSIIILNEGAESSANPQVQEFKETLAKEDQDSNSRRVLNKRKYNKKYRQKNKEKVLEKNRNYYENNKEYFRNYRKQNIEKINENHRNYYKMNDKKCCEYNKIYYQKNKENWNVYQRNYRQKKKNDNSELSKVQSDNNKGNSFVNPQSGDFINKGKMSIVREESFGEVRPNKGKEECNNGEDKQNQIEVEEPNKILENDKIDLNKTIYSYDLNEKPEDEE